jgi:hypothetical protein
MQGVVELCGFLSNGDISIPLAYSSPVWYAPTVFLLLLDISLIIFVFSLFPNGRFIPGWMRWLVLTEAALIVIFTLLYILSLQSKTVLMPLLITMLWLFIVFSIIGGPGSVEGGIAGGGAGDDAVGACLAVVVQAGAGGKR